MITEDYVSFETAKLLKEKGFNERLLTFYITDEAKKEGCFQIMAFTDDKIDNNHSDHCYLAPTLQMAIKWLREVHNLFIEPYVVKNYGKKKLEYTYSIQDLDFQGSDDGIECCKNLDTPEQACEEAIKYCLGHLI